VALSAAICPPDGRYLPPGGPQLRCSARHRPRAAPACPLVVRVDGAARPPFGPCPAIQATQSAPTVQRNANL